MVENEGHRTTNLKRLTAKVILAVKPERVIALTQDFVRIPSVSGQEGELGQFMAEKLKALGFDDVELQEADENRFNVLCTLRGKRPGPTFLFEGHLDTVQTEGMAIDPYSGDFSGGRIYGRGASDMKGGLAAMIEALKAIKDSGVAFDGTIIYAAVVGEEGAGKGLDKLIASGLKADMGLVGEATELTAAIGNKGVAVGDITTKGLATHSSVPHFGVNAIYKMCKVMGSIQSLPLLQEENPIWGRSTVNTSTIEGGRWLTCVPDRCRITFDFRLNPEHTVEMVKAQLEKMLQALKEEDPGFEAELGIANVPGAFISPDSEIVNAARKAVQQVLGKDLGVSAAPYWTDAAFLIERAQIPTIILGPGRAREAHSSNDWVAADQVVNAAKIYACLAIRMLSRS